MGEPESIRGEAVKVGTDLAYIEEDRVLVYATYPMDWPVREFCRIPIYFRCNKYFLAATYPTEPPFHRVYELLPWPTDLREASTRLILYEEAYVMQRNAHAQSTRLEEGWRRLLFPFHPFLGLCWSGFKERTFTPLGFNVRAITGTSVFLVFTGFVIQAIFVGWLMGGVLVFTFSRPGLRILDWGLMLLLGVDAILRYHQCLDDDAEDYWGFCEWLQDLRK